MVSAFNIALLLRNTFYNSLYTCLFANILAMYTTDYFSIVNISLIINEFCFLTATHMHIIILIAPSTHSFHSLPSSSPFLSVSSYIEIFLFCFSSGLDQDLSVKSWDWSQRLELGEFTHVYKTK